MTVFVMSRITVAAPAAADLIETMVSGGEDASAENSARAGILFFGSRTNLVLAIGPGIHGYSGDFEG